VRRARIVLAVGAATLVAAPTAGAATFCVNDPGCAGTTELTIQAALDAAANNGGSNRDRIQVGPGNYAENNVTDAVGNFVDVVGAGRGVTTIAPGPAGNTTTLSINEPTSTVQDLSIRTATGGGNTGLGLAGTALRVEVTGNNDNDVGAASSSGVFRSGSIVLSGANSLGVAGLAGQVDDSVVTAQSGVSAPSIVTRSRITAAFGVIPLTNLGSWTSTTIQDTVIRMPAGTVNGIGVQVVAAVVSSGLTMSDVTMVGAGPNATGLSASASGGGSSNTSATATLDGVVLRGFATDLRRTATGGGSSGANATTQIDVDYSDYDPAKTASANNPGGATATGSIADGGHNLNVDPRFVDEAAGDLRLRGSSPLVDRGRPGSAQPPTDLAGAPRVVDGNGDGAPVVDMGALEYQRRAPAVTASVTPASGVAPLAAAFSASASDPDGEAVALTWSFGDGVSATGPSPTHVYTRAGTYTATVAATDEGGVTSTATAPVTVAAAPRVVVSSLGLTNATFTWGAGPTAITAAARRRAVPRGTTFRFRLSAAAMVKIALARVLSGRRSGRRCVRPTARLVRLHARRCTRYVVAGTLTRRNRPAGLNRVAFSGRLARRRLPAGRYRATLTATALGARASVPRRVAFRIVAP
jgi:PKD repeat protein